MTTCPISLRGKALHVSLNVSGIDSGLLGGGSVKVEVLDEKFVPVPGYTLAECQPIQSGLRQPVVWASKPAVEASPLVTGPADSDGSGQAEAEGGVAPQRVRVRVTFGGEHPGNVRLYAIQLSTSAMEALPEPQTARDGSDGATAAVEHREPEPQEQQQHDEQGWTRVDSADAPPQTTAPSAEPSAEMTAWLATHKLSKYAAPLAAVGADEPAFLRGTTAEELREMGVEMPALHARALDRAIAEL